MIDKKNIVIRYRRNIAVGRNHVHIYRCKITEYGCAIVIIINTEMVIPNRKIIMIRCIYYFV